jgi:hypothetical protein
VNKAHEGHPHGAQDNDPDTSCNVLGQRLSFLALDNVEVEPGWLENKTKHTLLQQGCKAGYV